MSYDANARRDTPLALKLKDRIRRGGPIAVDRYLEACLHDPQHGYYVKRPAIGAGGDFITAPEISQMFGELIGLWCVVVWQQMGAPGAFNLIEFGPGRGTLMRDALRAMRVRPEVLAAVRVVLLDCSEPLTVLQRQALAGIDVPFSTPGKLYRADDPQLPAIIIGNEFIDTEPIEQFVRTSNSWDWRRVGLDDRGELAFTTTPDCPAGVVDDLGRRFPMGRPGDIGELYAFDHDFRVALGEPSHMAALFLDYGHLRSTPGDTLQAVRNHAYEHPLTSPGEADITAQVDFQQVAEALASSGRAIDGPVTQAEFLGRLGIIERASKLMAANPDKAGEIEIGVARLMSPGGMGGRFKAIGVRSEGLPPLPGLELPGKM
jgi:NADH dehydrogenase [ubiquinone] 1 alpha subcomplex assembly factor 7